jgi:hypothetical protein
VTATKADVTGPGSLLEGRGTGMDVQLEAGPPMRTVPVATDGEIFLLLHQSDDKLTLNR